MYLNDRKTNIYLIHFLLGSTQGRKIDIALQTAVYYIFIRKNEVMWQTFAPKSSELKEEDR